MKWLKIVLIPLAIIAVVLGVFFKLSGLMLFGIAPGAYLKLANTLFLIVIVVLLMRIAKQSELF